MSSGSSNSNPFWNLFSWWRKEVSNPKKAAGLNLLPVELRTEIWSYLSWTDKKSVKEVCKLFQMDIDRIVGVQASLSGPAPVLEKKWKIFGVTFFPSLSYNRKQRRLDFKHRQKKQLVEKANWIRSVLPRSLTLRRFSKIRFDPSLLVTKPPTLHGLIIETDQSNPGSSSWRIRKMLLRCNNLKQISFTCHAVDLPPDLTSLNSFRAHVVNITREIFNSLQLNRNLTELSVSIKDGVDIFQIRRDIKKYYGLQIIGNVSELPLVDNQWLQNPVRLTKLCIHLPALLPVGDLRRLKKFLDAQDRLTHLTANLGLVRWNYFSTVLQKNASSLEALDVVLTNWNKGSFCVWTPDINIRGQGVNGDWFNWNLIAPLAKQLKSLRLSSCNDLHHCLMLLPIIYLPAAWPLGTLNFQLLKGLQSLEQLSLDGIQLNENDLSMIFTEFPALRNVELISWMQLGDAIPPGYDVTEQDNISLINIPVTQEFTQRNRNFCQLLNMVMSLKKFSRIHLVDFSLMHYSEELRKGIFKRAKTSSYSVTWRNVEIFSGIVDDVYFNYPLIIQA